MIEIWGKTNCPNCAKAKQWLDLRNIDYVYKQLDTDFTREQVFEQFPTAKVFPQIMINNKSIGSYNQMVTYLETMGYK